ncbi:MAG: OmpH family outer membrane protein [Planctomycetes bacterium]|nr:OmpH family outer membrane protein [Planctomycetota bacterium]
MKQSLAILLVFIAALCWFPDAAAEDARPLKVGVVNIMAMMKTYQKSIDMNRSLEARFSKEEEQLKSLKKEIEDLASEIKVAGINNKDNLVSNLKQKEYGFKLKREMFQDNVTSVQRQYTQELYREIKEGVELFAKQEKFDLIIKKSVSDEEDEQQLQMEMLSNVVFFASPEIDVTEKVVELLNVRYQQLEKNKK